MSRPLRHLFAVVALAGLLAVPLTAGAEETSEKSPGVTFTMTTGVFTPILVDSGELFGAYLYVGPNAVIPVSKKFAVITGAGFEVAPAKGNYGAVGLVIGEYLVNKWLGLDAIALLAHDEDPALEPVLGRSTTAYASVGAGTSFFFANGLTLSPMVTYDINVDGLGQSVSPSVFLTIPFP